MVEIIIDTQKDSKQDIRKVIDFLQKIISDNTAEAMPEVNEGAFNIFGNAGASTDEKNTEEPEEKEDIGFKPIVY
ncbi:hypothetical protein JXB41_05855 [Candidatus Woesearchaeota archaeon]|nr:hypothetical protein [Candidatus Woesearchaeota archaeon]